jgi:hypothetical protein
MIGRATLKRGLIALWCLAAAGCAKVTNEAPKDAATAEEAAAVATAASLAADAGPPDSAPLAPVPPLADGMPNSVDLAPANEAPPERPSTSTADLPPASPEVAVIAPAAPVTQEPERESELVASSRVVSPPSPETLDFTSLVTRLRKTKAISLRTKVAVKNESDDLLERFRAYHAQHGTVTLAELRRSYDSLFLKLYSLLEDADPPLARDIDRSRAAIWSILADPLKFGASPPVASARSVPPA